MKKGILTNVILSLELSILFVSAIFLSQIINYKNGILSLVYIVFVAILYGFTLISKDKKMLLLKWGLSIPFSYIIIHYFWQTNYSIRALNWIFPNYGETSAGGKFSGLVLMLLLFILSLVCGIVSLSVNVKSYRLFEKLQLIITSIFVLITVATVLILEQHFPSYQYVIYS